MTPSKISRVPISVITSVLCWYTYSASLKGDFVFDDTEAIVRNPDVNGDSPWWSMLTNDFWGTPLYKPASHKSYRPIATAFYRLLWWVTTGNSYYFRLSNLCLHVVNCMLLHRVLLQCLDLQYNRLKHLRNDIASVATLLFSVHPIHTESICSAVGFADILSCTLFLLGLASYLRWVAHPSKILHPVLLTAFTGLAVFTKEPSITLLGVCIGYEVFVISDIIPQHIITRHKSFVNSFKKSTYIRISYCALLTIILSIIRCFIIDFKPPVFQLMDNPHSFVEPRTLRFINYNYIYSINAYLLINPFWSCFDWSMSCIPVIQTYLDPRIFIVLAFWAILAFMAIACCTEMQIRRWLCTSMILMITPFIPSSNLFFRVGFVIAERNLYLPSIGFCLLLALSIVYLPVRRKQTSYKMITFGLCVLLCLYVGKSIRRTQQWSSEESLFRSGLSVCPLNAKVHYNIAKISNDRTEAVNEYKEALRLNPSYDQAMNNLANIYKDEGKFQDAKQLLEKAVGIRKDFAAAWMNLGIVEAALKNFDRAEYCYKTAIRHRNKYPFCYYNLGNMFLEKGEPERALVSYETAVSQKPDNILCWNNMVILLDNLGRYEQAVGAARKALHIIGDYPVNKDIKPLPGISQQSRASLHFNIANTLGKMEQYELSEVHFVKAISLHEDATFHANLGVLYHRWGRRSEARAEYTKALQLNPKMVHLKENISKLDRATRRK